MRADVLVYEPKNKVICCQCGRNVPYDLRGVPPGVTRGFECVCGATVKVQRDPAWCRTGPSEVK